MPSAFSDRRMAVIPKAEECHHDGDVRGDQGTGERLVVLVELDEFHTDPACGILRHGTRVSRWSKGRGRLQQQRHDLRDPVPDRVGQGGKT